MKVFLLSIALPILLLILPPGGQWPVSYAQAVNAQALKFNKTIHNFGKIAIADGPRQCTFEFTNVSEKPVLISNILAACGCTEPEWPKKPIMPGQSGSIKVTFLNDQGPYPFDKSLTVYTSASTKPIILRISGIAYEKEKSFKDLFPVKAGALGLTGNRIRVGQIDQGEAKSVTGTIANLSGKTVKAGVSSSSPGLEISIRPEEIAPQEIAEIIYTVDTRKKEEWGHTVYRAELTADGMPTGTFIEADCMIIGNFSGMSKEEKAKAPTLIAKNSSFNFGTRTKGAAVSALFQLRNTGVSELTIYKTDTSDPEIKVSCPRTVRPGELFEVRAEIDTGKCKTGDQVFTITLITNSPRRPLVNLFITGILQ